MTPTIEERIRERYTQLRRVFQPGYSPNDQKIGAAWDKTAAIVRRIGADPERFVQAQFDALALYSSRKDSSIYPFPAQLHSSSAEGNYERHGADTISTPEARFAEQDRLLAANLDEGFHEIDVDMVLASPALDFKSWYRILMCSEANLPEFEKVCGSAARIQVQNCRWLFEFIKTKYAHRLQRFSR